MSRQTLTRHVTPEDLDSVFSIEQETFDTNAYPRFFFRQAYDVFGELFRVAEMEDGEIAGYILGSLQAGDTVGWIVSLAVRQEHRRKGIAKSLLNSVLERLSDRGTDTVLLTVEPANTGAIEAYRDSGFREVESIPDCFGPGEPRIVMGKELVNF